MGNRTQIKVEVTFAACGAKLWFPNAVGRTPEAKEAYDLTGCEGDGGFDCCGSTPTKVDFPKHDPNVLGCWSVPSSY